MRKTLCAIVTALTLFGSGCVRAEGETGLGKEVTVPTDCRKVLNFGYNGGADRYFVTCQKDNGNFSFYSRVPSSNSWNEMHFLSEGSKKTNAEDQTLPGSCQHIYNLGYNYASSRAFVSCEKPGNEFSFYTQNPKDEQWKEVKFKTPNGKLLEGW